MQPAPREYTHGIFFERPRRRFDICGTRQETDGTILILKCRECNHELNYSWLKKKPEDTWTGDFGKRVKLNLNSNRAHRRCRNQNTQAPASNSVTNNITNINNNINNINIVIVNLPAVTRKGSTDVPLMCSDIPLPDGKTVKALLDNPETAVPNFVKERYFATEEPSITQPNSAKTLVKIVHRDQNGNHWVEAPFDRTVDNIVYNTLDTLDDDFHAMRNANFKDWKKREGLTATIGFDKTDAYEKMQSDVADVLKNHGAPFS